MKVNLFLNCILKLPKIEEAGAMCLQKLRSGTFFLFTIHAKFAHFDDAY